MSRLDILKDQLKRLGDQELNSLTLRAHELVVAIAAERTQRKQAQR